MSTSEELFNEICKMVAEPHTIIVKHDMERTAKILLSFYDYVLEHEQCQEDTGGWVETDSGIFRFYDFLVEKFGEDYVEEIAPNFWE